MAAAGIQRRYAPSFKCFLPLLLLGSVLSGSVFSQLPVGQQGAIDARVQALVDRLEAAEAEIQYLRQRDREREQWQQDVVRRLPEVPPAFSEVNWGGGHSEEAACDCSGESVAECPGVGPLCRWCEESLSWNKGAWRIVPFGFLTGEMIGATEGTISRPMILYIQGERLSTGDQFTVHGQTTALGLNFSGPCVGDFQVGGMILFNFLGDRPALNQATPFFLRGYGELRNDRWRFRFGQQGDLFNPLDPVTVNFGGNKQAGNGGSFRGSFRADRFVRPNAEVEWTYSAAVSQQVVTDFVVDPRIVGTDNGWPNLEGRIGVGLGPAGAGGRPIELGVSGVIGETKAFGVLGTGVFTTWGVSADLQLRGERIGTRAEFFVGQAIGTYNLGIGQSLDPTGFRAIRSVGGWADVWYKLTPYLTTHIGFGIDDPNNNDVGQFLDDSLMPIAGQRKLNQVGWANLMWDVTDIFQIAFEIAHRKTDYVAPSESNSAMIYHFRSQLRF